jgi:D-psicose/D-tagatose/L-ribulose 3-epimerase
VPSGFRFAICNEVFGKIPMPGACKQIADLGYDGIEIAPFTLAGDPSALDLASRKAIGSTVRNHSLAFVGLHWLLVGPEGLHATTRDESVRQRTWNYVRDMIDLCADLAAPEDEHKGVLVFGSPKQRSAVDGMSPKEATDVFVHELAHVAPYDDTSPTRCINCQHVRLCLPP